MSMRRFNTNYGQIPRFRGADNAGVGASITTSAFIDTSPTDETITSGLPVT
jgi:hypothetical protein